jgi:hypothetical protein
MEQVMELKFEGNKDCEHNYVYSRFQKMTFVIPPTYFTARICEKCGRYEILLDDEMINHHMEQAKFIKLKEKFEKGKNA